MTRIITVPELQKNNDKGSCWVAFRGKVYDLTDFAEDHPGGRELILEYGGKDVSEVLFDPMYHTHTEQAIEMMDELCIGHLFDVATEGCYTFTSAENDYKTEKFLNINEPLFDQMYNNKFTKDFYLAQVHKPRYAKESIVLFSNPFLEALTRTPWYVVPIFWFPIIFYFGYSAYYELDTITLWSILSSSPFLICIVEYLIHRFLFHIDDYLPDYPIFLFLHFFLHGIHHYMPMDRLRLVLPPVMSVPLAAPFVKLAFMVMDPPYAKATVSGFLFGYVCYDLMHYFLHHSLPGTIPEYFREMKRYHLAHHHEDYSLGFGVTSKTMDRAFNTVLILDEKKSDVYN